MPERQSEKYAREAREMLRKADLENRDATPEERGRIEELIARAEEARRSEEAGRDADAFARSIGNSGPVSVYTDTTGSPGARFIRAAGYKEIAGGAAARGRTVVDRRDRRGQPACGREGHLGVVSGYRPDAARISAGCRGDVVPDAHGRGPAESRADLGRAGQVRP